MDMQFINSIGWLLTYGLVYLGIAILIGLVIRQFVLWYFRLNQIADDLSVIAQYYRVQEQKELSERISQLRTQTASIK